MGHRKMVGGAIKISNLLSELPGLKIFVIRFGEKVHIVNTYYVKPLCSSIIAYNEYMMDFHLECSIINKSVIYFGTAHLCHF